MQSLPDPKSSSTSRRRIHFQRWLRPFALLLAGFALQSVAHYNPLLVEHYYSGLLYPILARASSLIGRPIPFSLSELLILVLPIIGLAWVLRRTKKELDAGLRAREIFASRTCELIWILGIVFLVFQILFGLNYQRPPLVARMQLADRRANAAELEAIAAHMIDSVNRNFALSRDNAAPRERSEVLNAIEASFQSNGLLGVAASGGFAPPKPVFISTPLTRLGISGIYSPFTGEPNFNREQPESELPFAVAHEKAHQRGYAREDEASFVAFLVCTGSSDPFVRYSGYLRGLRVLAALKPVVPPETYRLIIDRLDPGVRADLQENAAFWQLGRSQRLSRAADRANDTYLKANNVKSGTANYGEVVALIISYYLTYPSPAIPSQ